MPKAQNTVNYSVLGLLLGFVEGGGGGGVSSDKHQLSE